MHPESSQSLAEATFGLYLPLLDMLKFLSFIGSGLIHFD